MWSDIFKTLTHDSVKPTVPISVRCPFLFKSFCDHILRHTVRGFWRNLITHLAARISHFLTNVDAACGHCNSDR